MFQSFDRVQWHIQDFVKSPNSRSSLFRLLSFHFCLLSISLLSFCFSSYPHSSSFRAYSYLCLYLSPFSFFPFSLPFPPSLSTGLTQSHSERIAGVFLKFNQSINQSFNTRLWCISTTNIFLQFPISFEFVGKNFCQCWGRLWQGSPLKYAADRVLFQMMATKDLFLLDGSRIPSGLIMYKTLCTCIGYERIGMFPCLRLLGFLSGVISYNSLMWFRPFHWLVIWHQVYLIIN